MICERTKGANTITHEFRLPANPDASDIHSFNIVSCKYCSAYASIRGFADMQISRRGGGQVFLLPIDFEASDTAQGNARLPNENAKNGRDRERKNRLAAGYETRPRGQPGCAQGSPERESVM
jgi:hypothetical protein